MRTARISALLAPHKRFFPSSADACSYVYVPTPHESRVNVDGVSEIVLTDASKSLSKFRVNDFRLQTLVDAGIDPSSIAPVGYLSCDPFSLSNLFDKNE